MSLKLKTLGGPENFTTGNTATAHQIRKWIEKNGRYFIIAVGFSPVVYRQDPYMGPIQSQNKVYRLYKYKLSGVLLAL